MGILQSVLQSLGFETDEEESGISTRNSVNLTPLEKWEHARRHDLASPTRSHQMKYETVSVPDLRDKNLLPIQNPAPNESFLVPTPLNNASILENAFGIDDEQAQVESDHDAAVFVGEISNHEIEEEEEMQIKSIVAVVEKRILQSVLQSLGFETDEEESSISARNSYNLTPLKNWEHARRHDLASPTRSHQMKYETVSVPDLRDKNLLPIQNPAPNESFLVPTPLNNASILENAFGVDDEQAHVESDHDAAVFVGEISNHEIEEEEEEEMQIKRIVAVVEKRKIKHYKKQHKILLVGEGDFSFSACLAVAFGSATNIIATSLNSKAFLEKNYGSALSNIAELRCRGSKVMHGVDATKIATHKLLAHLKFDRIVFNFPFAGFFRKLSPESRLRRHRRLVSLFLKNAKEMVSENGEIHISNKTNGVNAEFNLESIASSHGLRLIAAVKFKCGNYPGYNAKYGFGGDTNFNCYPSNTFKFGLKL